MDSNSIEERENRNKGITMPMPQSFYKWLIDVAKERIDAECKFRVTLFDDGNPIWSTEKKKTIWIALFRGEVLKMLTDWWDNDSDKLNHIFKFKALKDVELDKALIELREGSTIVYSREWPINKIFMIKGDSLDLAFEIKLI